MHTSFLEISSAGTFILASLSLLGRGYPPLAGESQRC